MGADMKAGGEQVAKKCRHVRKPKAEAQVALSGSTLTTHVVWKIAMKLSMQHESRILQHVSRSMVGMGSHKHHDDAEGTQRRLENESAYSESSEARASFSRSSLSSRDGCSPHPIFPPFPGIDFLSPQNSRKRARGIPMTSYVRWSHPGLRPGLSVRVVRAEVINAVPSVTEYVLQVVDLHTKVFWIVKKRFHEFYLLRKKIRALVRASATDFEQLKHLLELPFPRRRFRQAGVDAISRRMEELELFLRNVAAVEPVSRIHVSILTEFQLEMCSAEFIASLQKIDTSGEPVEPKWLSYDLFTSLNSCATVEGHTCYKFLQAFRNRCAFIEAAVCPQCKNFAEKAMATEALRDLRNVVTSIEKYVMDNLGSHYGKAMAEACETTNVEAAIEECVHHAVEDTILIALERPISFLVGVSIDAAIEERLAANIEKMRGRSQTEFGIPVQLQSDDDWGKSCHHLSMIDERSLPSEKIQELLRSALEVFRSCGAKNLEWSESSALTADDYLPIHIYVVVHSGLRRPLMTKELLGAMIHPSKMLGEDTLRQLEFTHAARQFGRTAEAKHFLNQVSTAERHSKSSRPTSWTDFVQAIPGCEAYVSQESAVALVSAAYSFPLTLAMAIADIHDKSPLPGNINVLVVGARAEAMLPVALWNEVSILHPVTSINLVFIGDHVPVRSARHSRVQVHERLSIRTVTGFYHELELDVVPDVVVMFNPGIGHPHLKKHWAPTIHQLLHKDGPPVLMSSFSQQDQARDIAMLEDLFPSNESTSSLEYLVKPQVNPFRSLQYHVDPTDPYNPVQVNQRVLLVRAK
ncbi:TPA: hypothetical protein N0F65_002395 [Lagenidium giganteum]|uniref:PX domain-containing protein n=1 Tax=Lagenidium giganteum TaxID=4803 RepID=A0AAV2YNC5_9STRA|nr:TPA: hypothetical protein N0F65_002395 [Lagenidium giganteum]